MKISLLINMKMPTSVGIFIFINREIFTLSWVKHEKSFITSGLDPTELVYSLLLVHQLLDIKWYRIYSKYWDTLTPYRTCPIICKNLFHYLLMWLKYCWTSSKQCRPWSDATFWVYTLCSGLSVPIIRVITAITMGLFKLKDNYSKKLRCPNI